MSDNKPNEQQQQGQTQSQIIGSSGLFQSQNLILDITLDDIKPLSSFLSSVSLSLLNISRDLFHQQINNEKQQQEILKFGRIFKNKCLVISLNQSEQISISTEIQSTDVQNHSIAFVKRQIFSISSGMNPIEFSSLLQVINLGYSGHDTTPISINHLYVQNCFLPIFYSYKEQIDAQKTSEKESYNELLKKLNQLNLALIQCQQNVEVPEIQLQIEAGIRKKCLEAKQSGKEVDVTDFAKELESDDLITQLTNCVLKWIKDISQVCKSQYDIQTGNTMAEINYWISFERSLNLIEEQMNSPEVNITIKLLENQNKFNVTNPFKYDINFKNILGKCQQCNQFTKDFPINELLSAHNLKDVEQSIQKVFTHMKRYTQFHEQYRPKRAFQLLEAVSRDLNIQMIKILKEFKLMSMPYGDFVLLIEQNENVFRRWNNEYQQFREKLDKNRILQPQQAQQLSSYYEHIASIKARVEFINNIRKNHEKFKQVIEGIIKHEKSSNKSDNKLFSTKDINDAYIMFYDIDVLDTSKEGHQVLIDTQKMYDLKIEKLESSITSKLVDKLGLANSANEMFRIFAKFNSLFFRPQIRGAIHKYQSQLLQKVQKDIKVLQEKFKKSYSKTDNYQICNVRDIPKTAGEIIWVQQIKRKLDNYLDKVESVLGEKWTEHIEGKKCYEEGDQFKQKLNFQPLIDGWTEKALEYTKTMNWNDRIFQIVQKQNKYQIVVNFDQNLIQLFKEIRFMQAQKVKLNALVSLSFTGDLKKFYPSAVSIQESIHQYNQITEKIDKKGNQLMAKHRQDIQQLLQLGMNIQWNQKDNLTKFAKNLTEKVLALDEGVNVFLESSNQINAYLGELKTCPIENTVLKDKLGDIQKCIDDLSLKAFSNLNVYASEIDNSVEQILSDRIVKLIASWLEEFEGFRNLQVENRFISQALTLELKIKDQEIFIEPPIQFARYYWTHEFNKLLGVVCSLQRIQNDRFNQFQKNDENQDSDYSSILLNIKDKVLLNAYEKIDNLLCDTEKYVETWLSYSALWKIDVKKIYDVLGEDITLWQEMLNQIKQGRSTFDNSETEVYFGATLIDYRLVQVKINNKYDQWHKEILNHFGDTFSQKIKRFFTTIGASRAKLEKMNLQNPNADVMQFISELRDLTEKQQYWGIEVDSFKNGYKLLERQRYQYPQDWLWAEQLQSEWQNFKQFYDKRNQQFEKEKANLQGKIISDEEILNEKIQKIEDMWNTQKPYSGDLMPVKALDILNMIDQQLERVTEEYTKCCKCKELLNLEPGLYMNKIEGLNEDVQKLKEVWIEMNKVWVHVEELKDLPLKVATEKKIKDSISNAQNQLQSLPFSMNSQEPYIKMKDRIKQYKEINKHVINLKSEALREKHWKILMNKLKIKVTFNELTIGILWAAEINKKHNEDTINEILTVARGELVLEGMIKTIKEFWSSFEFELARYQTKCKLIRGWDELFAKFEEDLSNLSSMKISPYYKTFEEEIQTWDEKLQKYKLTLDIWIEVQRRWVYLESIFFGSSDIKQQLSNEYNRFKSIDSDFTGLMKKVATHPQILSVMQIPQIQNTLERLKDLLEKIQKALGDYLETQRKAFARFYFVGDEDLLEIIGNSRDASNVQRHFTKMYAGITSLLVDKSDKNGDQVKGMTSREGESVNFDLVVSIAETPKINEWLGKIDDQMRISLASRLENSLKNISQIEGSKGQETGFIGIIEKFPAQIVLLSLQVLWCNKVEKAFEDASLSTVVEYVLIFLALLAENVVKDLQKDLRQKFEQIITDFVHQRDVTRDLLKKNIKSSKDFSWQYHMRFAYQPKEQNILKKLMIQMANASFEYGFEYLGVGEKLVQTPLTDKCYLTLTQALHLRMGGSPFGPAGTGKTESVKALGSQLGRFVLVFNCDETFDFHAMGRIFVGLCQVGAWGCFDEFNRLEERMLSAVSQQILVIQTGLKERVAHIELMNREVKLNPIMGVFITMNPGYAGRANLPENLKQLFRQMAMVKPDRDLIAQVMLYSQGFRTAEKLSGKIVSFFELCNDQLSSQPHYDFGLRALKSVLVAAGHMKRQETKQINLDDIKNDEAKLNLFEQKILLRSVCETIVPKLVAEDVPLLSNLLSGVFPGSDILKIIEPELKEQLFQVCKLKNYMPNDNFIQKVLQLFQIQRLHHGVMMVGPSGSGKSAAWRILLESMFRVDKIKGESYIIDPKAISKDELYGKLDNTTMEWTDGVFTGILRRITENQRGESNRRHWVIFDGDVDPEWAENLNSVLDDNKLLTLPNGERIQIPPNVKIMFEVETLRYATLATVSRCGMVWFSDDIVDYKMMFYHYLQRLLQDNYDEIPKEEFKSEQSDKQQQQQSQPQESEKYKIRKQCVEAITPLFEGEPSFIEQSIEIAATHKHVMEFTKIRVLEATFALIRKGISNILDYNEQHPDLPLPYDNLQKYITKWTIFSLMWGVAGSMALAERAKYGDKISQFCPVQLPNKLANATSLIDFEVLIEEGEWAAWIKKVPVIEINPQQVSDADVIITTVDTLRHQEVLCSWLSEHRPFILCGPPGSGKTMTLMSTLRQLSGDFEMIFVNFSSTTNPQLILKQFEHYCDYVKTTSGIILKPKQPSKWLVVFCDEINLPDQDKYGTMIIITFLRELTEHKGFWRASDRQWISLERIQFVGACNPPTDVGRKPLSDRFLRHCPLIFVDFPGKESLKQIYGTFNRALLKKVPTLRGFAEPLTNCMVEFYTNSQLHFTSDMQPHYIYSPRELTRWKYAINESLEPLESVEDLIRLWAHEAMRLFEDRLVHDDEKTWCQKLIDSTAMDQFQNFKESCLERPILFTNYLSQYYKSVERAELRKYITARLATFNEEELNVQIVVFDSVLDHILRIDRVLRQPLGHLLLVGASGVGKTTLSRFVSWMNNLTVFQIKAGRKYSLQDFDIDLREVMKKSGVKEEKICFIFDESNALSPAFLEKMNALLASGEIPGLFEGEEYMSLMNQCREAAQKDNKMVDSDDQLYRNFIKNVQRNLHVVFTMNPANPDFSNRTASSPALFNRCVIDWFGDWSEEALYQVAKEFTLRIEINEETFSSARERENEETRHNALVQAIVNIHKTVDELNKQLAKSAKKFNFITPRDFLDFISHFVQLYKEKKEKLEDEQLHLNVGLNKIKQTEEQIIVMKAQLDAKNQELQSKEKEANEKLDQITKDNITAQTSKTNSLQLSKKVDAQKIEINSRKSVVDKQLNEVQPMLDKAKENVNNIQKKDLDIIKSFKQPPALIKLTLEAVICVITNHNKELQWGEVLKEVAKSDFKQKIINFNTDDLKKNVKEFVFKNYLNKEEWKIDGIYKASSAAGPLAEWVDSQLRYSDILLKVDPLKNEVDELQKEGNRLEQEKESLDQTVRKLEIMIAQQRKDLDYINNEKFQIQHELESVKGKVERAQNLLGNLSSERYRWSAASLQFKQQMATLIGDVLISGAFCSYIGFFDHFYRRILINAWKNYLETQVHITFKKDMALLEFLSKPSERLEWNAHGLPKDDLCTENAIILSRYKRYPLVIDPSGQALEFILQFYKDKKIVRTSFADEAFMKNLESSLRFGVPLLVQDVEKIDPILNSVLNKEIYKTGGRILIRVGDQEIDFSQNFQMFMITRDSSAKFTPDLCSRVTFVNFTVTPGSLQNQCLNYFLKNETPAVEEKRINQMKLQGEFSVQLRDLEDKLLRALSDAQGSILENETVINQLENLKKQANMVQEEINKSDQVIKEIEKVMSDYIPLSQACSKIYFALISMTQIHYLYEFSLFFYMQIFTDILIKNEQLQKVSIDKLEQRRTVIFDLIFQKVFDKVSNSLLQKDKIILALKLVQIKLQNPPYFINLIRGSNILESSISDNLLDGRMSKNQIKLLEDVIEKQPEFQNLLSHIDKQKNTWITFLESSKPEEFLPQNYEPQSYLATQQQLPQKEQTINKLIKELILIKVFRPDRFQQSAYKLIEYVLGDNFMKERQIDMKNVVEQDSNEKSPILMCSAPGFDPSFKVEQLSKECNVKLLSVALGSQEGFQLAENSINQASTKGMWVLLKNVHLAPSWLSDLEKKIHKLNHPHQNFRLFLTMEFNPKVPATLIRQSFKLVFEPPDGIKASLTRSYSTLITQQRSDRLPKERARLHFLLSWLHSVLIERLRYTPIGYSKIYEFNEADQRCALDLLDEYVDALGKDRQNIDPDKLPWQAIQVILTENLYGGKIDNEYDKKILASLVDHLFTPESFNTEYKIFFTSDPSVEQIKVPEAINYSQFKEWINLLPNSESPAWSGLPLNVEKIINEEQTIRVLQYLLQLQDVNEEEIESISTTQSNQNKKDKYQNNKQVQWLKELLQRVTQYLQKLPKNIESLNRTSDSINNPLFRFLEREVTVANNLLKLIKQNLNDLKQLCDGTVVSSNFTKKLAKEVHSDQVPERWLKFNPHAFPLQINQQILDYKLRFEQYDTLIKAKEYQKQGVWLGQLWFPEAYLTATRQYVAQNHKWSLEELELKGFLYDGQDIDDDSFLVYGMNIEGADWSKSQQTLTLTNKISIQLPPILFKWVKFQSNVIDDNEIMVPVYLNKKRKNLIFSLKMNCNQIPRSQLYQKSIALIAWNEQF